MKKNSLTTSVRDKIFCDFIESQSAGTQIMAEIDLSKKYGVSMTTIRRAIDLLVLSHHLVRRHGSGTYVLRPDGILNIGILVPEKEYTNFFTHMACELQKELTRQGYDSVLFIAPGDTFDMSEIKCNLPNIDALVVCGYSIQQAELASLGIPYLFVGNEQCQNVSAVGVNFLGAIDRLIGHLLEQGCQKLCFITHHDTQNALESSMRYHAFRQAMAYRRIPFSSNMVIAAGKSFQSWSSALDKCLEETKPDGIICSRDDMAVALIPLLHAKGIQIPRDICITGCNDLLPVEKHPIPLTTIGFPMELLAHEAVCYITNQIFSDRRDKAENINVMLPLNLVVRKSSLRKC